MNYYLSALQNFGDFNGRARRSEYWYFALFNMLASIVVGMLAAAIEMPMLYVIFVIAMIVPGIAVTVRRMHDANKSGWFCLIPLYNFILTVTEGTRGDNEYGSDPKEMRNNMVESNLLDDKI